MENTTESVWDMGVLELEGPWFVGVWEFSIN